MTKRTEAGIEMSITLAKQHVEERLQRYLAKKDPAMIEIDREVLRGIIGAYYCADLLTEAEQRAYIFRMLKVGSEVRNAGLWKFQKSMIEIKNSKEAPETKRETIERTRTSYLEEYANAFTDEDKKMVNAWLNSALAEIRR